jgi:hypothetical protein
MLNKFISEYSLLFRECKLQSSYRYFPSTVETITIKSLGSDVVELVWNEETVKHVERMV